MSTKMVLAAAGLVLAAAPALFQVVNAAPDPRPVQLVSVAPASDDKRFKPVCRGDEVLDSRPDPAWVSASFNNDQCRAPRPPARLDGSTATREQVVAAMAAAKDYAAAANAFQKCVSDFVAKQHAASGRLTPSQAIIENHRILVSQRSKETAAAQVRVAINAFNRYGSDCPE